ncbi:hypothetical protein [Pseudoalteromonas sp.]|uniref:hypothetical protein n=1 Tax=Pseudoalteromonas sp. TaxID=53249 RepID=UPI003562DFB3
MPSKLILSLACAVTCGNALANADIIKLQQAKSESIAVTKSANYIDFTPLKNYDKYIISVSGPNGFSKSFESDIPSLDINSLNLPTDGTFNYQIQAITYLYEIKDTMNNGRPEDARGYISKVDVADGKFTTENFAVITFEQTDEKHPNLSLGQK